MYASYFFAAHVQKNKCAKCEIYKSTHGDSRLHTTQVEFTMATVNLRP